MVALFRSARRLVTAVWLLVAIFCMAEVGLRLRGTPAALPRGVNRGDTDLIVPSNVLHHEMRPMTTVSRKTDSGKLVTWHTNSKGLRGTEIALPKPPQTYRVLCLGDERVLGPQTSERRTGVRVLEQLLQSRSAAQVEVINAGVPDYSPLLSYLQFEQRLAQLQPDLVILNFDLSDVADDYRYRRFVMGDGAGHPVACPHSSLKGGSTPTLRGVADNLLMVQLGRQKLGEWWCSKIFAMPSHDIGGAQGMYRWLHGVPPDWEIHVNQTFQPMALLRDRVQSLGATFVVTVLPAPFQLSDRSCTGGGVRSRMGIGPREWIRGRVPQERIAAFCRKQEIACCDLTPDFEHAKAPERLYCRSAVELSAEGHALWARGVGIFLVRQIPGVWRKVDVPPTTTPTAAPVEVTHSAWPQSPQTTPNPTLRLVDHAHAENSASVRPLTDGGTLEQLR